MYSLIHRIGAVFMVALLLCVSLSAEAQRKIVAEMEIHGVVVDDNNQPIPGATITVEGDTMLGKVTELDGSFSLMVPENATIIAAFIGYESMAQRVSPHKHEYRFQLSVESHRMQDVVVVGYGEVKKSDLTGSVSVIGARSFEGQPVRNVADVLQGRSSGVEVTTTSGMPGAGAKVRVRGTTSINKSSDPLYVIDGIISTSGLDGLNPQDIASMQVLKDASSTAVYGSRGANGVILVTTRNGEAGRSNIYFDAKIGVSDVRKNYDLMNAYEYALALNDIRGAGTISESDMELYRLSQKGIDWVDMMTRTAITQNYNIGASGGSDKVRYLVSGQLLDQEAVTIDTKYMRYGLRANIDADVRPWLMLSTKINGAVIHQKGVAPNWFHVLNYSPTMELRDETTGVYNKDPYNILSNNPYGVVKETDSDSYSYNLNANMRLLFRIAKGLTFSVQGGYDFDYAPSYSFVSSKVAAGATNSMRNASSLHRYWQNSNNLTYSDTFNKHTISATGVWELSGVTDTSMTISGTGLSNESVGYWDVTNAATRSESNSYTASSLMSGIARLSYDYDKRYFFTAALRADASSKFQKNHRWGYFPSAAVAWDIAQESFMQSQSVVEQLKLRASYGIAGNEAISAYNTLGMLSSTSYGWGTSTGYTGYWGNTFANPDLTWEKTTQWDVGLDFSIAGINISFDWFRKDTEDLLFQKQVPHYNGGGTYWVNQGALRNMGYELSLNTFVIDRAVKWETTANVSYIENEVVDLAGSDFVLTANYSDLGGPMQIMKPGYPLGSFYVYEWLDFDEAGANVYRKAGGGTTTAPTSDDLVIRGNAAPRWLAGWNNTITWRNLSINIFFSGAFDYDRLNISRFTTASMSGGSRFISLRDAYFEGWDSVADKQMAKYPSVKNTDNKSYANTTFWLEDASFVKLKNISIAYTLPRSLTRFADIQLSVSAQDLFVITGYKGMDPEVYSSYDGLDYGAYPVPRTITFGLRMSF